MTEAEWRACDSLGSALGFIENHISDRKLRLFSCACCRRVWDHLNVLDRGFIESAERIIDGTGTVLDIAQVGEVERGWNHPTSPTSWMFLGSLFHPRRSRTPVQIQWSVSHRLQPGEGRNTATTRSEEQSQLALLRDIAGNPFRSIAFSPESRTDTAVSLARMVYESREFSAMPILADALQDAGCDDDDLLNHCRSDGPHVRGCWVVDLVLGKG
jgi:hypothetical protein